MFEQSTNPYLEQEVLTASPAKLRWMLLNKSVKLSQLIGQLWEVGDLGLGDQWCLRLRDILTELLSGVHGQDPTARQVADLYVFLIRLLTEAEQSHDSHRMVQLQSVLEEEAETWLQVQQQVSGRSVPAPNLASAPLLGQGLGSAGLTAGENSFCIDA